MDREQRDILFMQTRMIRLASERWNKTIDEIVAIFKKYQVLQYVKIAYGIFECEGDDTVLDEIEGYLEKKGCMEWTY